MDDIIRTVAFIKPEYTMNDIVLAVWNIDESIKFRTIRGHTERLGLRRPVSIFNKNSNEIISKCYMDDMTGDELIKAVLRVNNHVPVTTISRHLYRLKARSQSDIVVPVPVGDSDSVVVPDSFSYEKRMLLRDIISYKVPLVYNELKKYGFDRQEIIHINETNKKEVVKDVVIV